MKIGYRKPSLKKEAFRPDNRKAQTKTQKSLIPGYGKKGMGWLKNPEKALYNKIYNKTSRSIFQSVKKKK